MFYISEMSFWLPCGKWIPERQWTEADDGGLTDGGETGGFESAFERGADRIGDEDNGYGA